MSNETSSADLKPLQPRVVFILSKVSPIANFFHCASVTAQFLIIGVGSLGSVGLVGSFGSDGLFGSIGFIGGSLGGDLSLLLLLFELPQPTIAIAMVKANVDLVNRFIVNYPLFKCEN